jgi:rhodanese-related sulfurtransferase
MTDPRPAPQRLSVKLFVSRDPEQVPELEPFIGLFHRFIQEQALEGLLIDVADYAHVPEGPGILLVGHDVDYGIDLEGGRTGLLVTRKRYEGLGFTDALRDTLRKAFGAARAIEASGETGLAFRTDALQIRLLDRLVAPNDDATFGALRPALESVLGGLYGDAKLELERDGADDARRPLGFRITAQEAPPADALLERLGRAAAPAAQPGALPEIEVEDLRRLRDEGVDFVLLDVREEKEYEICHLDGKLIPLGSLPERVSELDVEAHVVVHCRSGGRSAKAVELLLEAGFRNVWNVRGGILAWIERIDPSLTRY